MADYKRIIKNIAFIVLVPSVVVVGYYATKYSVDAFKKYRAKKDELDKENSLKSENELGTKEEYKEVPKAETKVIPINRETESTELEGNKKVKEA